MLRLALPLVACSLVLGVATYYQGVWSERWNEAELNKQLQLDASHVKDIPVFVGDWKGTEQPVDPVQLKQARVVAHQSREYRNVKSADKVGYFLVCGKPRHVAIHTPDDCYVASGFQMLGKPQVVTIETAGGKKARFWSTVFRKVQGAEVESLRIFWAWNDGKGGWEAPDYPRLKYGIGPSLYKMYCIVPVTDDREVNDQHPCVKFIKAMLPVCDEELFAKAPEAAPATPSTTMPAPAATPTTPAAQPEAAQGG